MIARDLAERLGESRGLPLAFGQRRKQAFDALQEHADFRHVATQKTVNEAELLRRRRSVVDELTNLTPIDSARLGFAQATDRYHGLGGKVTEELRTGTTAGDLRNRRWLQVAGEERRRGGPTAARSKRNRK